MGSGGFIATTPPSTHLSSCTASSAENTTASAEVEPSIRLQYPKSSRLLLGTTANLQQPGFLKALEVNYPLELSLSCDSLANPPKFFSFSRPLRPFAMFFCRDHPSNEWELIGRTETVTYDIHYRFVTKLKVCCATPADRSKVLRVEVYDRRTKSERMTDQLFVGAAECQLEDIISEPLLRKRMKLQSGRVSEPGWITLAADIVRPVEGEGKIALGMEISSITKGSGRVFYVLSRQGFCGEFTPVYRSEVLGKTEKRFKLFVRDTVAVTAGLEDKLLRVEIFQWGKNGPLRLGFVQTSLEKLRQSQLYSGLLWWPCEGGEGAIEIGRVVVTEKELGDNASRFGLRVTT